MTGPSVIVIGAGPAGLSAAHELACRGAAPLVLEMSASVGGISRTQTHKGNRFDIGGHRFFSRHEEVNRLWQEMLGADLLRVHRLSRIYYQGRFLDYPLRLASTVRNLGPVEASRMLMSYLWAKLRPQRPAVTFEQWVTNRFGRRLYRRFFQAYTEKVWGIPCREIQADWAAQRIGGLSLSRAILNALRGASGHTTLLRDFLYPVLGPGMMWERFRDAVVARGGRVLLNSEVIRLEHGGGRLRRVILRRESEVAAEEASQFISSMPLADLIERLAPPAPEAVRRAGSGLRYRSLILVGLVVKRQGLFPDNWIYVHEPAFGVGRIQNFGNWSPAMLADPGKSSLGMEYFCNEGDAFWRRSDESLIRLAGEELEGLGLARRGEVADGVVIRQAKAYAVYDPAYQRHLRTIREYLGAFDNLQVVGRNGMHRYNNQDHSMLTGIQAARNILQDRPEDLWGINAEGTYIESAEAAPARRGER